ncbi:MAG TPA: hypothetical protein P5092_13885 [Ruminococcus sp.]|nr:hypothetical protein [Ruminococcus sp.]
MKRRMIAITAFMAVALAGCGQIDEPLTSVDGDNQPAAQIEIQTEKPTDAFTSETNTEAKTTSSVQQTTEGTTSEATETPTVADSQGTNNTENDVKDNNTPQQQAETKQPVTEADKPITTVESTSQSTTQAETTSAPANTDNGQTSDVFKMLDSLNYQAISCDGLPTHKLTAPDGTVYYLHLDENASYSYVWRRPSLIAEADNEAPLTQEVIDAIYANWDQLNIVKTEW